MAENGVKKGQTAGAIVVGGGPAGLTAAIALASAGLDITLIAKPPARPDMRTTALLASSVTALDTLGVWECCRPHAAPLRVMRIVDDTGRLIRAPEVKFDCAEIGLDAFGHNIENRHLVAALEARAGELPSLRRIESEAASVTTNKDVAMVTLGDGAAISAPLVIGADGRRSLCRQAAGIKLDERSYPQSALALSFSHTRAHGGVSTEFHTPSGPFTLVPLPGNRSSLVWVLDPEAAEDIAALDDAALSAQIERRSHSILGKITVEGARGLFPLGVATAQVFGQNRIALVGEAAHIIPPIGAQGLNLGLRDAATIGELIAESDGGDVAAMLARYDGLRRTDVKSRTLAIDLLNRSLLSDFLPVQSARGLGLYLLDRIGPLRRAVMREGVAPAAAQPRLMRGEAI